MDGETVESLVIDRLRERGWSVSTIEEATLGQVGARIADADQRGGVFAGSVIVANAADLSSAPPADVVLSVGPIGVDPTPDRRTRRPVEMKVTTPLGETSRVFEFGGDDERVRSFAAIAGLHLIRIAIDHAEHAT